jgi:hypothetical protein
MPEFRATTAIRLIGGEEVHCGFHPDQVRAYLDGAYARQERWLNLSDLWLIVDQIRGLRIVTERVR